MSEAELNELCDRLKEESHTTGKEIIKQLAEIAQKPVNAQTAWDAKTFAGAVLATLRKDET